MTASNVLECIDWNIEVNRFSYTTKIHIVFFK